VTGSIFSRKCFRLNLEILLQTLLSGYIWDADHSKNKTQTDMRNDFQQNIYFSEIFSFSLSRCVSKYHKDTTVSKEFICLSEIIYDGGTKKCNITNLLQMKRAPTTKKNSITIVCKGEEDGYVP
jgi:hypothetical protein